jgi:hypothetical protein
MLTRDAADERRIQPRLLRDLHSVVLSGESFVFERENSRRDKVPLIFSIISTARRTDMLLLTGMTREVDENPCGLFCELCRIVESESTWLAAPYQIITQ